MGYEGEGIFNQASLIAATLITALGCLTKTHLNS